jgi:hypothetical protein
MAANQGQIERACGVPKTVYSRKERILFAQELTLKAVDYSLAAIV